MIKLQKDFYERETLELSKDLLGKIIVRKIDDKIITCRIVETEAYKGIRDRASHAYGGRRTKRTEVMFGEAGKAYVYQIYGMYFCLNIVAEQRDNPCAVLIRAVEPLEGIELISQFRFGKPLNQLSTYQKKNITNGPGKLCKALKIDKNLNGFDLCTGNELFLVDNEGPEDFNIQESKRINIDYAEEAKDYLWRFYIEGNEYISKK